VAILAGGVVSGDAGAESTCVTCHEVDIDARLALPVPEWRDSVHARSDVSCDACHGGDPRVEDADGSMSPQVGFEPAPRPGETVAHCGACHEEVADRYRAALASGAAGNERGCAGCHLREGHRVREAGPEQLAPAPSCPECATPGFAAAREALLVLRGDRRAIVARVAEVERRGFELADQRALLDAAEREVARALHEFDPGTFGRSGARSRPFGAFAEAVKSAERVHDRLRGRLDDWEGEVARRRGIGAAVVAVLVFVFVALHRIGRRG
jgi:hypothetical protein